MKSPPPTVHTHPPAHGTNPAHARSTWLVGLRMACLLLGPRLRRPARRGADHDAAFFQRDHSLRFGAGGIVPNASVLTPTGKAGLPRITMEAIGAQMGLRIEFLRRVGGGLVYQAQESSDLTTYSALAGVVTVVPVDDFWERVTISAEPSDAPRRFFRVSVSRD